ncbi:hypothetical protein Btru_041403 [Bulinus truncatus]|nr:hypothetical protein Btru_041403 [Bulinus truncatus]
MLETELVSLSNSANKTGKSVNSSSSSQDLSTQLHCIPTPPSSPSTFHVTDSNHSSSHGNQDVKNSVWNPDSYAGYRQDGQTGAAAKDYHSSYVDSHQYKTTASPKVSSPKVAPAMSPVPQGHSRTLPYNPHPSPPFTPSSQRCLASPRCPTPGPHTSGCTTPISDSSAAPNRFVPIQTSGILGSSAVGYIQPIRPVVTNVANVHPKSSLPSQVKSKPLELSNFLGQEAEQNASTTQRKDQPNNERPVPPALVLSLTGGIGSVSGKGMKDGWAGHEMTLVASGLPNQSDSKPESGSSVMMTTLHLTNDMLPTYEEAISLLVGSQSNYSETLKKTDRETVNEAHGNDSLPRSGHSISMTKPDTIKPVSKAVSHLSQVGQKKTEAGDKTKHKKVDPLLYVSSKSNLVSFPQHQPPTYTITYNNEIKEQQIQEHNIGQEYTLFQEL